MADKEKLEKRVRRLATRYGYRLMKSRESLRSDSAYSLINSKTGGALYHFTNVSLDKVEKFFYKATRKPLASCERDSIVAKETAKKPS